MADQNANVQVGANGSAQNTNAKVHVDTAVNGILDTSSDIEAEERSGDSEADLVENDRAELQTYADSKYEIE